MQFEARARLTHSIQVHRAWHDDPDFEASKDYHKGCIDGYVDALNILIHLDDHLNDGLWHDNCHYCMVRRVHGGTGIQLLSNVERRSLIEGRTDGR